VDSLEEDRPRIRNRCVRNHVHIHSRSLPHHLHRCIDTDRNEQLLLHNEAVDDNAVAVVGRPVVDVVVSTTSLLLLTMIVVSIHAIVLCTLRTSIISAIIVTVVVVVVVRSHLICGSFSCTVPYALSESSSSQSEERSMSVESKILADLPSNYNNSNYYSDH